MPEPGRPKGLSGRDWHLETAFWLAGAPLPSQGRGHRFHFLAFEKVALSFSSLVSDLLPFSCWGRVEGPAILRSVPVTSPSL